MASHFLILFLLTTATPSPQPLSFPPSQPPFSLLQPPSPSPSHNSSNSTHKTQFNSIINTLIQTGDFKNWANFLSSTLNPAILPLSTTLFIPNDNALIAGFHRSSPETTLDFIDPLLFLYHIVPHRLSFAALCKYPTGSRLPTLLPGFSLLITNHSSLNFTINGARVIRPDLYRNAVVSVHGVGGILDYTLFGKDPPSPVPEFHAGEVDVTGDGMGDPLSDSAGLSCGCGFWGVLFLGMVALFFGYQEIDPDFNVWGKLGFFFEGL